MAPPAPGASFTPEEFRRVMGNFATGVAVVTTRAGSAPQGLTVNAFTSLSLAPPLILVCIDKSVNSHGAIAQSGVFAVNILARDQEEVSKRFADKAWEGRRFEGLAHRTAATGAPILDGAVAYIDCRVASAFEGGDHTIFVGKVEDLKVQREAEPLLFFRGKYARVGA